jgi:hypothetical protein
MKLNLKAPVLVVVATGVGVAATCLGGCGHGADTAAAPAQTKTVASSAAKYVAPKGAISDLSRVRCARDDKGVWSVTALLANNSKRVRSYNVMIAVVQSKTSEVLGEKTFEIKLAAGGSKTITGHDIYSGAAKEATCAPVVTLDQ